MTTGTLCGVAGVGLVVLAAVAGVLAYRRIMAAMAAAAMMFGAGAHRGPE